MFEPNPVGEIHRKMEEAEKEARGRREMRQEPGSRIRILCLGWLVRISHLACTRIVVILEPTSSIFPTFPALPALPGHIRPIRNVNITTYQYHLYHYDFKCMQPEMETEMETGLCMHCTALHCVPID